MGPIPFNPRPLQAPAYPRQPSPGSRRPTSARSSAGAELVPQSTRSDWRTAADPSVVAGWQPVLVIVGAKGVPRTTPSVVPG